MFIVFLDPATLQAETSVISLHLTCNIAFSHFNAIKSAHITKNITLTQVKHKTGGMKLVSQTADYEFWVMTHAVQMLNEQKFINNFQVAIKHKSTQLFFHALSDTSHSADKQPQTARISLVDYYPDSTLEKGELFFECHQARS